MSIPAINWCIEQRDLPPGEWVVLFHLCHCHNHEKGRCDPSQEYLASMTNMGLRTVQRHLTNLQGKCKIYRQKRGTEGGGRLSDWYVLGHEPAKLAGYLTRHLVRTNPPSRAENVHEMAGKQEVTGIEQEVPPVSPPQKSKPEKARLPEAWCLNKAGWDHARQKGLHDTEIEELQNDFRIYWSERSDKNARKTERGWEQTWRNRVDDRLATIVRNRRVAQQSQPGYGRQGGGVAGEVFRRHSQSQS